MLFLPDSASQPYSGLTLYFFPKTLLGTHYAPGTVSGPGRQETAEMERGELNTEQSDIHRTDKPRLRQNCLHDRGFHTDTASPAALTFMVRNRQEEIECRLGTFTMQNLILEAMFKKSFIS